MALITYGISCSSLYHYMFAFLNCKPSPKIKWEIKIKCFGPTLRGFVRILNCYHHLEISIFQFRRLYWQADFIAGDIFSFLEIIGPWNEIESNFSHPIGFDKVYALLIHMRSSSSLQEMLMTELRFIFMFTFLTIYSIQVYLSVSFESETKDTRMSLSVTHNLNYYYF